MTGDSSARASERPNALVVGGSGMLSGLVRELVSRGYPTTVVARGRGRLDVLAHSMPSVDTGGYVVPLPVDYSDLAALRAALRQATSREGLFTLAVLWIHGPHDVEACWKVLAESLTANARVVHVLGSAVADPSRNAVEIPAFFATSDMTYRQAILGFRREPSGHSRWLTHTEISEGVLAAVDASQETTVVGQVRPWPERPG